MNNIDSIAKKKRSHLQSMLTPEDRIRLTERMFEMAQHLALIDIRETHPGLTERQQRQELFLRFYRQDFSDEQLQKIIQRIA